MPYPLPGSRDREKKNVPGGGARLAGEKNLTEYARILPIPCPPPPSASPLTCTSTRTRDYSHYGSTRYEYEQSQTRHVESFLSRDSVNHSRLPLLPTHSPTPPYPDPSYQCVTGIFSQYMAASHLPPKYEYSYIPQGIPGRIPPPSLRPHSPRASEKPWMDNREWPKAHIRLQKQKWPERRNPREPDSTHNTSATDRQYT